MVQFEVEHYAVRTELRRVDTSSGVYTYAARILRLTGRPHSDAAIFRASLQFSTLFEPWYSRATVGKIDCSKPFSPRLSVWLPASEFASYYDILCHECPVYFAWEPLPDGFLSQVHLASEADTEESALQNCELFGAGH
jgi:hypothetical protein